MVDPSRIRIAGPLEPHVGLVWSGLLEQGYTPLSSRNLLHLMSHLSRWLEVRALQAHDLTNARSGATFTKFTIVQVKYLVSGT